jgi:trk system potassium uptake protein TrkA
MVCPYARRIRCAAPPPAPPRAARHTGCSVGAVHFVIMGCGRVGATLARSLSGLGHDVAVIDMDPKAFRRLGSRLRGPDRHRDGLRPRTCCSGRRDQEAYAFAAVSSGDNSNILAARVARETFGVERVAARIYDPRTGIGLPAPRHPHRRHGALDGRPDHPSAVARRQRSGAFTDPSGKVVIAEVPRMPWPGSAAGSPGWKRLAETRVAYLTRLGEGCWFPGPTRCYQDGDLVHVAVQRHTTSPDRSEASAHRAARVERSARRRTHEI